MKASQLLSLDKTTGRLFELDALRGIIMILMALDHARTFLCPSKQGNEIWIGSFTTYNQDWLAFLTRFVSHLSAPGFFLLMGCGMVYLYKSRQASDWTFLKTLRYFAIRGCLLILFQFLLENRAWALGFGQFPLYFGVLFGLGTSMILGSFFVKLPARWLAAAGLFLLVLTDVLLPSPEGYPLYPIYQRIVLLPGFTSNVLVFYPIIPWFGVTLIGMAFGKYLITKPEGKHTFYFSAGLVLLVMFFIIRSIGGFGNIRMPEETGFISFLNVVKYPPSIALLLISLGINLLIAGFFSRIHNSAGAVSSFFVKFGQAPLFFYITHLFLYASIGVLIGPDKLSYLPMYGLWAAGIIILFPFCAFFARLKHRTSYNSIIRFF